MKLKYNKRSTEWLRKGIPSKIDSISLLINGESIELNQFHNIEVQSGSNKIGAIIKLSNGDTINLHEKDFDVTKDMQLHLLFANKNLKIQNMLINPIGLGLMILGIIIGLLIPAVGILMLFAGMIALTVTPNTYAYKKHGSEAFKILLT